MLARPRASSSATSSPTAAARVADVRPRQPLATRVLERGEDRHQQGHARQLVHRLHRRATRSACGSAISRRADARRLGRHRRGAGVARHHACAACEAARAPPRRPRWRHASVHRVRAGRGTGAARMVRCRYRTRRPSAAVPERAERSRIAAPGNGLIIAIDPDIPARSSARADARARRNGAVGVPNGRCHARRRAIRSCCGRRKPVHIDSRWWIESGVVVRSGAVHRSLVSAPITTMTALPDHESTSCRRASAPDRIARSGADRREPLSRLQSERRLATRIRRSGARSGARRGVAHRRTGTSRTFAARLFPAPRRHVDSDPVRGGQDPRRQEFHDTPCGRRAARQSDLQHGDFVPNRGRGIQPSVRHARCTAAGRPRRRNRRCANASRAKTCREEYREMFMRERPMEARPIAPNDFFNPEKRAAVSRTAGCARVTRFPTTSACTSACSRTCPIGRCSTPSLLPHGVVHTRSRTCRSRASITRCGFTVRSAPTSGCCSRRTVPSSVRRARLQPRIDLQS